MTTYAHLKDGLVDDIVKVDPFTIFSEQYASEFIEANDDVEYLWQYDGNNFIPSAQSIEYKWTSIRNGRNMLLAQSDFNVLPDRWAVMTSEKQQEWSTYRQALRDIPQTFATPEEVVWPTKPE